MEIMFKNKVELDEWMVSYNIETELSQVMLEYKCGDEFKAGGHRLSCCETGDKVASIGYCKDGRIKVVFC